jgi:hypothetical protein
MGLRQWILCGGLGVVASVFAACGSDDEHIKKRDGGEAGGGAGGELATSAGGASGSAIAEGGGGGAEALPDDLGFLKELCERFAQAECGARDTCFGSNPSCVTDTIEYCHLYGRAELLPALNAGIMEYDADAAEACFSDPLLGFCSTNNLWSLDSCRQMFRGVTATGSDESCYRVYFLGHETNTCKTGYCDAKLGSQECGAGRCQPYLGDQPCIDAEGVRIEPGCGPGRLCDYPSKHCVDEKAQHEACTSLGESCNNGLPRLFCVPKADGSEALECDAARPAGSVCGLPSGPQTSIACESLVCTAGKCADKNEAGAAYCFTGERACPEGQTCLYNGDPPTCGEPVAEGDPCHIVGSECDDGLSCVGSGEPDELTGTCQPLAEEGESCAGASCAVGLRCAGEPPVCATIMALGEACAGTEDCVMGTRCLPSTGTCGKPALLGQGCSEDGDCEPGLFCGDDERCRPWQRNGEPCERQQQCVYGNGCGDDGVCASLCTP